MTDYAQSIQGLQEAMGTLSPRRYGKRHHRSAASEHRCEYNWQAVDGSSCRGEEEQAVVQLRRRKMRRQLRDEEEMYISPLCMHWVGVWNCVFKRRAGL
jgi:hypothetical protein